MLAEIAPSLFSTDHFSLKQEMNFENIFASSDEPSDEKKGGLLPSAIVFPVMLAASIWKLMVISLVGIPWQSIIWVYVIIDFVYGQVIRIFIGTICTPCAWLFIAVWKIVTLPLIIFGWFFRIMIASLGALVDGWMLIFGGSGCFLRWGYDCRFAKRLHNRSYWEIMSLPIWMRDPANYFESFKYENFES